MVYASYHREQAIRARRLAGGIGDREITQKLHDLARDYDENAADLEASAVEVRHPELMPQQQRD
jgi:hypothetical protein